MNRVFFELRIDKAVAIFLVLCVGSSLYVTHCMLTKTLSIDLSESYHSESLGGLSM